MADEWNGAKPVDSILISEVPGEMRSIKTNARVVISKEHVGLGDGNSGGQHKIGAARVHLQSGLASLDPEGNALSIADTSDNGRIAIDTSANNILKVYVATSNGISTGWRHVSVGRLKAIADIDASGFNVINVATGTQSKQAIRLGQISTEYFSIRPSTALAGLVGIKVNATTIQASHANGLSVVGIPDGCVSPAKYADNYLLFIHETSGSGGTLAAGDWRQRPLNKEVTDLGGYGSLTANRISLVAGKYVFRARGAVRDVQLHQCRFYNVTDSTVVANGTSEYTWENCGESEVVGLFTITESKVFELQHRSSVSRNDVGFGQSAGFGLNVFAQVEIWKVG